MWSTKVLTNIKLRNLQRTLESTSQTRITHATAFATGKHVLYDYFILITLVHPRTRFWMLFTCLTQIHFWFRISQNAVKLHNGNLSLIKTLRSSLCSCHVSTICFNVTQGLSPTKMFWVSRTFCFWNWRKQYFGVSIFKAQMDRTPPGHATKVVRNKPVSRTYPVKTLDCRTHRQQPDRNGLVQLNHPRLSQGGRVGFTSEVKSFKDLNSRRDWNSSPSQLVPIQFVEAKTALFILNFRVIPRGVVANKSSLWSRYYVISCSSR